MGIHVEGDLAYLAAGKAGLSVFDISTPDFPKLVGACETSGDAWDVWIGGKYAYVADLDKGLSVIDVSSTASPRKIALVTWDEAEPMAEIVRGEGNSIYIAAGKHGLVVVDTADPTDPEVVGRYSSGPNGYGEGLCVREQLVYLANGNEGNVEENGLFIIDAHDPAALLVRGKCTWLIAQ